MPPRPPRPSRRILSGGTIAAIQELPATATIRITCTPVGGFFETTDAGGDTMLLIAVDDENETYELTMLDYTPASVTGLLDADFPPEGLYHVSIVDRTGRRTLGRWRTAVPIPVVPPQLFQLVPDVVQLPIDIQALLRDEIFEEVPAQLEITETYLGGLVSIRAITEHPALVFTKEPYIETDEGALTLLDPTGVGTTHLLARVPSPLEAGLEPGTYTLVTGVTGLGTVKLPLKILPSRLDQDFRLWLTGFEAEHETQDDMLQRDGRRDEVYFRIAGILRPAGSPAVHRFLSPKTNVFGDRDGYPGRVDHAKTKDGVETEDDVALPGSGIELWWGRLSSDAGERAFIAPMVMEWDKDGNDDLELTHDDPWFDRFASAMDSVDVNTVLNNCVDDAVGDLTLWNLAFHGLNAFHLDQYGREIEKISAPALEMDAGTGHRPVGIAQRGDKYHFRPWAMPVNFALAHLLSLAGRAGFDVELTYTDHDASAHQGRYTLRLRMEALKEPRVVFSDVLGPPTLHDITAYIPRVPSLLDPVLKFIGR